MKVLYISSLVSERLFEDFVLHSLTKGYVGQKYHGLFVQGLTKNLGRGHVTVLSQPPISHNFWTLKDSEDGTDYRYIPILNIPLLKQLIFFLYSFFYTICWAFKNRREDKVLIASVMRLYQYIPVRCASLFFKSKKIAVACDIPWLTTIQVAGSVRELSFKEKVSITISKKLGKNFDYYVLLTERMNLYLNPHAKPHIVIEGFSDIKMANVNNNIEDKHTKNVVLYAGGINAAYGISNLVEAVKNSSVPDIELWLFGHGDLEEVLMKENNPRIKYFGGRSNVEVVRAELQASLLINPRPTLGQYTHYSFPSKTMEYMASGTYTATTRLAGIPQEYYNYCFLIEDYTVDGLSRALEQIFSMGRNELHNKGLAGKKFVIDKKNNVIQLQKFLQFITHD